MGDIGSPIQHDSHFPPCFKGRKEGSQKKKKRGGWGEPTRKREKKEKKRKEGGEEGFLYFDAAFIICSYQGAFMV